MAILSVQNEYTNGQSVTADNLNALVNNASFVDTSNGATDNTSLEVHSGGYLQVKDDGITNGKIATGAVNADSIAADAVITAKIADSTGDSDGVTTAKIAGNAITSAKISDTDAQFLVDDTSTQKKVVVNEAGADVDFRVEGDTDQNLLVCDATNDRVVVGATAPTESSKFSVVGDSTGGVVASIENAATTGTSVLVVKGPDPITQYQDTTASTGKTFNIGVQNDSIYIDLISGGSATRLFQLSDAGQLQLKSGMTIAYDL
mgnify:CR=1 FL=1